MSGHEKTYWSIICISGWYNREREMFYLTTHSTHFTYGYMASDIWLRTILIVRKETCCRHIGYSYRLTARVLLYAPSHRQDNTYHSLCYTSRGVLAGTRNSVTTDTELKKIKKILTNWTLLLTKIREILNWFLGVFVYTYIHISISVCVCVYPPAVFICSSSSNQ